MPSREPRRAERRKRKQRGAERVERGYSRARERDREVRESLVPLREDERPAVVTVAALLSALVGVSTAVGYAVGVEVEGDRPELVQALAPALLMGLMAWGLWKARYWAVLGFQTILLFLIFAAVYGLAITAGSLVQVLATLALLAVAGTLFWFMVKAMARIQMPHRLPRE